MPSAPKASTPAPWSSSTGSTGLSPQAALLPRRRLPQLQSAEADKCFRSAFGGSISFFYRGISTMRFFFAFMLSSLAAATPAFAQDTAVLQGRLVTSLSGDPIAAATVVLDELKRETVSGADGTFRFENLAPGTYHVFIRTAGYSSRRAEVTVTAEPGNSRRYRRRSRSPFQGSRLGHRGGAQPVRRGSAHDRARGAGARQTDGELPRRDAREPARPRLRAASARRHRDPLFEGSTAIAF